MSDGTNVGGLQQTTTEGRRATNFSIDLWFHAAATRRAHPVMKAKPMLVVGSPHALLPISTLINAEDAFF